MLSLAGVIGFLVVVSGARADPDQCDPDYECRFDVVGPDYNTYNFDFTHICGDYGEEQRVTDTLNHTYIYSLCGTVTNEPGFGDGCVPTWGEIYQFGAVVQYWDDQPTCNQTAPECTNPLGEKVCCSANCEVLGVGQPIFSLMDPNNPTSGGVQITYRAAPSKQGDANECPVNPKTGAPLERSATIQLSCDPDVPGITTDGARENTTCQYVIQARSAAACGCAPNCAGKNCGSDGCGGMCGTCPGSYQCDASGVCCLPDCTGRGCGTVCGKKCGQCADGYSCKNLDCVPNGGCTPSCDGKGCGSDGCGGSCGSCPKGHKCSSGQCAKKRSYTGFFFGGMILAVGLGVIGLAVLDYTRTGDAFHSYRSLTGGSFGGGSSGASSAGMVGASGGSYGSSTSTGGGEAPSSSGTGSAATAGTSGGYNSL